jgi:hypothetical protein
MSQRSRFLVSPYAALALTAAAAIAPAAVHAQAVFGTIVGTVTDPTGAVIPNATIIVTDPSKGTSQTVQSNGSGNYTVSRLIPDTYTVKASAQGFTAAETDNVIVHPAVGQRRRQHGHRAEAVAGSAQREP